MIHVCTDVYMHKICMVHVCTDVYMHNIHNRYMNTVM